MIKTIEMKPNHPPGVWAIWCPACEGGHYINTLEKNEDGAQWSGPGDVHNPTFMPSVNIGWGYNSKKCTPEELAMYRTNNIGGRCHFYVRQGIIEYCGDCSHTMAGMNVPVPPIEATPLFRSL